MLGGEDHICGADVSAGGHAAARCSLQSCHTVDIIYHLLSTTCGFNCGRTIYTLLSILFPMFTFSVFNLKL